ncbi:30S ribosomal protein S21 [candidate division WWE3 bacterium]|uniref:Small ribosomal subunit protein bS21 n=1 Tax=candidate division WWE3 bacterium TaxID=2053526 RepID=A0A955RRX8_UNCKA|nr:30S ribosomal protein S21 [candidate division WWE3 bacterium]
MLRRFNFAVTKSDLIQRLRDLQFYEKPSKRRQREEKMRGSQRRYNDD